MESENNIEVELNNISNTNKEGFIETPEINLNFAEKNLLKEQPEDGSVITSIKDKDEFIILCIPKINSHDQKEVDFCGIEIQINKFLKDFTKLQSVKIYIENKKKMLLKEFFQQKYFAYDFVKFSENKNIVFLSLFNTVHIYKIYTNSKNELSYLKIQKRCLDISKIFYLGYFLNKNNGEEFLEFNYLLKPNNIFASFNIYLDEKKTISYKERKLNLEFKMKLSKYYRGENTGNTIFIEKDLKSNYILYKNEDEILAKKLIIQLPDESIINDFTTITTIKIENIPYLICQTTQKEKNDIDLFFFKIILKNDIYTTELIQTIHFKNNNGEKYTFNICNQDKFYVNNDKNIFFVKLNNECIVDSIYNYSICNFPKKLCRYYLYEFDNIIRISFCFNNEVYYCKFSNEIKNIIERKFIKDSAKNDENEITDENFNMKNIFINESIIDNYNSIDLIIKNNLDYIQLESQKEFSKKYDTTLKKIEKQSETNNKTDNFAENLSTMMIKALSQKIYTKSNDQNYSYKEEIENTDNQNENNFVNYGNIPRNISMSVDESQSNLYLMQQMKNMPNLNYQRMNNIINMNNINNMGNMNNMNNNMNNMNNINRSMNNMNNINNNINNINNMNNYNVLNQKNLLLQNQYYQMKNPNFKQNIIVQQPFINN